MHAEGLNEGCDNHLSVSFEKDDLFLTLPYGILWSTVKPDDFVLVDFDGNIIRKSTRTKSDFGHKYEPDITAIKIHANIHKGLGARGRAVFHTHQHYATALACRTDGYSLEMVH